MGRILQKKLKHSFEIFEEALLLLQEKANNGPVSVKTLCTILSGRGKVLLLIFTSLFFSQFPGIAIPFGLFIGYLGFRIAFSPDQIWLPQGLLNKKIPSSILKKALHQVLAFLKVMKRWTYPREVRFAENGFMRIMNGLMIALVGFSLAMAPPIPFSGLIAFIAIFLIGIGLLNDDSAYLVIGYAFAISYFLAVLLTLHLISFKWILSFFS